MLGRGRGFFKGDEGAVAPLVAIAIIGLVGMGALAWDVSRAFAYRGELDAAADAAALAGATQLDGGTTALTRATNAARNALVSNNQALGKTPGAVSFAAADADILFLKGLPSSTTSNRTTTASEAVYIQVDLKPSRNQMGLIAGALFRTSTFNVGAHAVAGYGAALCLVPPIMICNPNEDTSPSFDGDNYTGKAFVLTPPPSGNTQWGPGNFGFLDVGSGASAVQDAMGRITPRTQCFGSSVVTEPGNITSADDWFNTRFDIYRGSAGGNKNDPEFAPSLNTIVGAKENDGNPSCTPSISVPNYDCSNSTAVSSGYGLPIDCNMSSASVTVGNGTWNAAKYFATNHGGSGSPNPTTYTPEVPSSPPYAGSGWNAYGPVPVSGATSPTRFQVYNWELAMLAGTIATPAWAFSDPASNVNPPSGNKDFARPTCNRTNLTQANPDRRRISAVVVNCRADDVRGSTTVHVIANVDFFAIAPAVSAVIYGEFIGQSSAAVGATLGVPTRRFWVRLYE